MQELFTEVTKGNLITGKKIPRSQSNGGTCDTNPNLAYDSCRMNSKDFYQTNYLLMARLSGMQQIPKV